MSTYGNWSVADAMGWTKARERKIALSSTMATRCL
jgi:hypothetical protein